MQNSFVLCFLGFIPQDFHTVSDVCGSTMVNGKKPRDSLTVPREGTGYM